MVRMAAAAHGVPCGLAPALRHMEEHEFRTRPFVSYRGQESTAAKSLLPSPPPQEPPVQGAASSWSLGPRFILHTQGCLRASAYVPVRQAARLPEGGGIAWPSPQATEITGTGSVPGGIYSLSLMAPQHPQFHQEPVGPHPEPQLLRAQSQHTTAPPHTHGSGWEGLTWSIICWRPWLNGRRPMPVTPSWASGKETGPMLGAIPNCFTME